jgi:radical SAM protein with 4Fe4S-binding SPASM domain
MYIKTISESKYQTFKQCQLKYCYRYVDRLLEPEEANTAALHFGSYIHKILEEGVNAKSPEDLQVIAEEVKGSYKVSKKYEGKDLKCINNFLKFNPKLEETVATELVFEVPVKDDITLNGVIDRVIKGKDGGYLVIDYKTSKREKSKVELYQDTQLKGYVYAISKLYEVPFSQIVAAHYYPLTNNFVHVQYSVPQINAHLRKIVDEVWKIRKKKKNEMKANRNEFCNWCAYKSACPEFCTMQEVNKKIEELKAKKKALKESRK